MHIDTTLITILGIPPYIFFSGIGVAVAVFVFNVLIYQTELDVRQSNRILLVSFIPLLLGAKMLGILYNFIACFHYKTPITLETVLYSGIVFFGGLLCFLGSLKVMSHNFTKTQKGKFFDIVAVAIPVFHTFGRLGCFAAGCCYGIKTKTAISVLYTSYAGGTIVTEWRIPIQVIEAGLNFLLFLILLACFKKEKMKGNLLFLYLAIYSVCRFFIEFFRGDWDRNLLLGISGSQIIAVIIIVAIFSNLLLKRKGERYV